MCVVLYARVSTILQENATVQLDELKRTFAARGIRVVGEYVETASGADPDRPELGRALAQIREGRAGANALAAVSLDRVTRNFRHLLELGDQLEAWGAELVCTRDGQLDTSTPMGRAMFQIRGVIAELERQLARERSREFAAERKAQGLPVGRASTISAPWVQRAAELRRDKGLSWDKIALALAGEGLSTEVQPATLSRRVRELLAAS